MTDSTTTRATRTGDGQPTETTGATETDGAAEATGANGTVQADASAEGATGAAATVQAAATTSYPVVETVNVRSGPGTSYAVVGSVPAGTLVTISCQTPGQTIVGPLGTSNIWDRIGAGRYVSDTYVRTGSDGYVAPRC